MTLAKSLNQIWKERSPSLQQKNAWDTLWELGLPDRKVENFKYIPLLRLYQNPLTVQKEQFTVVNLPKGAIELPLSKAKKAYGPLLQKKERSLLQEEKSPFALLNYALAEDGLFLYFPPNMKTDAPVEIHISGSFPRVHIFVGKQASIDLVINIDATSLFSSPLLDITMEDASSLAIYSDLCLPKNLWFFENVRASLKKDATLSYRSITDGAKTIRQDLKMKLEGERSSASLSGLSLLKSTNEAHCNIHMEHIAPNTTSFQQFKGILSGKSRSSFSGKIYVHRQAQQTNAYQKSNQLLLSDSAKAFSSPGLEIFADDVKATHGATISQLSAEELFYLKTRGLSESVAKKALMKGFCSEMLQTIPCKTIQSSWKQKLASILLDFDEVQP
ncbi:MAG: Fe-S cluster assembly protein SufD [Simkaniaceae bacterium]|nr:Fe-S cluster assembly protein SufD [Simkaniaceae bacterium]